MSVCQYIGVDTMLGIERRRKIMDRLNLDKRVYVAELSKFFNVTEETIRRDLEKLESQDLLRRSYGGAVLNEHTNEDLSFIKRTTINSSDKGIIAEKAIGLIEDGDTIMIDSSTTCLSLMQHLKQKRDLTIITNSIRLINDFVNSPFTMISTGGVLRANSFALTGDSAYATLRKYYVDLSIISCKGLDREKGLMESNEAESSIKQIMIAQARRTILLADHSKFNKTAFIKTCDFTDISTIVTDMTPGEVWMEYLAKQQIRLIY